MTKKEFKKLQELILMFEKDFRGICRKSGRTCKSFMQIDHMKLVIV